jgi:thiosulfate/3-mercaptopyruvate sulfurtransferase
MTAAEATWDEIADRLDDPTLIVLDVRAREEYDGVLGAPCCGRQGHIAGARHLDVSELMELDTDEIRERLGAPGGIQVIAYCHSGSRSALAAEILRGAGYDARNYGGSWHEWSHEATLPIEA